MNLAFYLEQQGCPLDVCPNKDQHFSIKAIVPMSPVSIEVEDDMYNRTFYLGLEKEGSSSDIVEIALETKLSCSTCQKTVRCHLSEGCDAPTWYPFNPDEYNHERY